MLQWLMRLHLLAVVLLPLPYNQARLGHIVNRIGVVQDFLGRQILLENVSAYVAFQDSDMTEWEFLKAVATESGCGVLFNANNIYASARNFASNTQDYLRGIDICYVQQIQVAGHSDYGAYVIDMHDAPICDDVFELYVQAVARFNAVNTMLERDYDIPEFSKLAQLCSFERL